MKFKVGDIVIRKPGQRDSVWKIRFPNDFDKPKVVKSIQGDGENIYIKGESDGKGSWCSIFFDLYGHSKKKIG